MRQPAIECGEQYDAARQELSRAGCTTREARAVLLWVQGLPVRQVRLKMQGHHDATSNHLIRHLLESAAAKLAHADLQERYAGLKDILAVWRGDKRQADEPEFPPTGGWFTPRFSDANKIEVDDLRLNSRECLLVSVERALTGS